MIGNPSRIEIWNELGSRAEPLDRLVLSIKPELALDFSIPRSKLLRLNKFLQNLSIKS